MELAMEGKQLVIGYGEKIIIPAMDVKIPKGKITSIIGPNGCGKSTLLKALARILPLQSGDIEIEGVKMSSLKTESIAKKLALLPQGPQAPEGLLVEELVAFGRYPYQKGFGKLSKEDHEHIERAMKATKVLDLKGRSVDTLSGGQRQRVWIAMALAQDTPIILLDEPTTYLDMAHQLEILELLKTLNEKEQKTIALVIHDLNLAARFSDHIIAMRSGTILYEGDVEHVMRKQVLADVFSLDAYIEEDPWSHKPTMVTYKLLHSKQ